MSSFIDFARTAAHELRTRFRDDPESELMSWALIARRREALVAVAYDQNHLSSHFDRLAQVGVSDETLIFLRRALGTVWAQEEAHQAYMEAFLKAVAPPKTFFEKFNVFVQGFMGKVEGSVIGGVMSPSTLRQARAHLAITLGNLVSDVPELVQNLESTTFSNFCAVNAQLEETAILGYERMLELVLMLPNHLSSQTAVPADFSRIRMDETYHHLVFRNLSRIFGPPDDDPPPDGGPANVEHSTVSHTDQPQIVPSGFEVAAALEQAVNQAYPNRPKRPITIQAMISIFPAPMSAPEIEVLASDPLIAFVSSKLRLSSSSKEATEERPGYA
jgi:hypothetical protein